MKVTTTCSIPPPILQCFNACLLSTPAPLLRESSKDLWRVYQYIVNKLQKKCKNLPKKKALFEQLQREFLELYERIKEKEKDLKTDTKHPTQRYFYHFSSPNRNDEKVFRGLMFR